MPALICYIMTTNEHETDVLVPGVTEQEIEAITAFLLQSFSENIYDCLKPKKIYKNPMPNFCVQHILSYNIQLTIKLLNLN